jgi:hypothetical protein
MDILIMQKGHSLQLFTHRVKAREFAQTVEQTPVLRVCMSVNDDNQARGPTDQTRTNEKLDTQQNRLTVDARELCFYYRLFAFWFFRLQDL